MATSDRRSLLNDGEEEDGRRRRSLHDGMNVFDDEFEVEDFDVVADGFRPGRRSGTGSHQDHDREGQTTTTTVAAHYATPARRSGEGPARNSTRKSRTYANPFASPEDAENEADAPLRRTPSGNFTTAAEMAHRSVSSASSNVYASTHSPRMAVGGPSHPYGMYPQGTMARTPSIATQSTVRPQRNSSVRGGPTHPYTMYPQGIDDDDLEAEESTPQSIVPVGFLGLGQTYARRIGPEGEDQDLIGDFGHTEQLPPYTRYPEDGPEKPLLGVPDPPTALHSRAPVQGTDPANPLMHTHIQPERGQSMTDESSLRPNMSTTSRRSTIPPLVEESSGPGDSLMGHKRWNEKTWSERRRTRMLCGIPFLWLAIGLVVMLFTGALVGGVIGGYVVGKHKGTKSAEAADSTSMYDADLIATPTAVPLPTGTFALPFGPAQEPDASCLVSAAQAVTWTCDFGGNPNTMIQISTNALNVTGANLYPGVTPTDTLEYGIQVDSMETQFEPFLLVSDRDDPQNGHAYYFQTTYNKVVVLPGDALAGGEASGKIKRDYVDGDGSWNVQKDVAEVGDKPWFCYWNGTSIEAFLYGDRSIFSSTAPSSAFAVPTVAPVQNSSAGPWAGQAGWKASQTISTTVTHPTRTETYVGPASVLPSWMRDTFPEYTSPPSSRYRDEEDWEEAAEDDDGRRRRAAKRHATVEVDEESTEIEDLTWTTGQSVPVFPYMVKIEERRKEGAPSPYCVQYQMLNDGTWNWIPDPDDDSVPITIELQEDAPSYHTYSSGQQRRRGVMELERRTPDGGSCHCQWMSGLGGS